MATASYKDLTAQIEKLTKQAEAARSKESQAVIGQIHKLIEAYGITAADLGIKTTRSKRRGVAIAPKYQDPQTGATWTGRGRAPAWIAGKDRSKYVI
jgi:DNA-binding protein H-NS